MTRTATDQDLYRRLDQVSEALRQQQQGLLQGLFNPFVYPPCDYATTGNVDLTAVFTSITDMQVGTGTLVAYGGMRILVWQQTNKVENGIYEVGTDNYLHRVADMLPGAIVLSGARVYVRNGYSFGNRDFFVTGPNKIVGTAQLTISPPRGTLLDIRHVYGNGTSGFVAAPGVGEQTPITAGTQLMRITYTPPVDAWWQCTANMGLIQATTAAWNVVHPTIIVTPADALGRQISRISVATHNAFPYQGGSLTREYQLVAGTTYTFDAGIYFGSAAHNYYNTSEYTFMTARATVR